MKQTLVEVKSLKGVQHFRVDASNVNTLRADLRSHGAELSHVQLEKFLAQGVGTHFDMDSVTYKFSVGYSVKKVG